MSFRVASLNQLRHRYLPLSRLPQLPGLAERCCVQTLVLRTILPDRLVHLLCLTGSKAVRRDRLTLLRCGRQELSSILKHLGYYHTPEVDARPVPATLLLAICEYDRLARVGVVRRPWRATGRRGTRRGCRLGIVVVNHQFAGSRSLGVGVGLPAAVGGTSSATGGTCSVAGRSPSATAGPSSVGGPAKGSPVAGGCPSSVSGGTLAVGGAVTGGGGASPVPPLGADCSSAVRGGDSFAVEEDSSGVFSRGSEPSLRSSSEVPDSWLVSSLCGSSCSLSPSAPGLVGTNAAAVVLGRVVRASRFSSW